MIVSIPFFFAGLALSLLFTRFPSNIHRLYAFDLAGAALGCLAIIFTMSYFGGGGSVLFAAFFATIAACIFLPDVVLWLPKHLFPESVGCFKNPSGAGYICP